MITAKTSAMITAIALLGAVAPAAFAQVTQSNSNTNTQSISATLGAITSSGTDSTTSMSITANQESGACQVNVGSDNDVTEADAGSATSDSETTGSIVDSDCS